MHIYTADYISSQRIGFFSTSKYFVTVNRKVGYVLARLQNYFTVTAMLFFLSTWPIKPTYVVRKTYVTSVSFDLKEQM